ncbi:MAG: cytochrome D ubiquinol oxidase subunit II, partial [Candidatus Binatia bacterium]
MTDGRRRRRSTPNALAKLGELIAELRPESDPVRRRYVEELAYTAIRLVDDNMPIADVKLLNAAMRELRYALALFAAHRDQRKISIFGSARTKHDSPEYAVAREFGAKAADAGFWLITGGGDGIMRACQE